MDKTLTKSHFNFLINFVAALGLTLFLADILAIVLNRDNAAFDTDSVKLFFFYFGISSMLLVVLVPIYFLLLELNSRLAKLFVFLIGFMLIIASLMLYMYYSKTNLSLGSDLYGYSPNDIEMIIKTSSDVSILTFWPLIVFVLFFTGLFHFLNSIGQYTIYLAVFLAITLAYTVIDAFSIEPTESNLSYFVKDSYMYFKKDDSMQLALFDESNPYPLLRSNDTTNDLLGQYIDLKAEKPNIVLIVVEGLGRDFSGDDAEYPGFTPYLDSLSYVSLTWTNFVSNTGRSFGALPSILGSLPFGKNGFLELDVLPDHISLINQLKKANYKTFYFEGGDSDFDSKYKYLVNEGMENIVDINNYGTAYKKVTSGKGFSWGYPDSEVFRKTLNDIKTIDQPRFDMILTNSNHEPFIFNGKEKYMALAEAKLKNSGISSGKKNVLAKYKDILAALLYTDYSIKDFITQYKSNPNYANSIFIITGDHRLIPIPQKNQICRYHVPLIIHSPMLLKPEKFKGICSQMDIMPSILALINTKYGGQKMDKVPWIGTGLSKSLEFTGHKDIPLSRYKGAVKDYVSGNRYISDNKLYEINEKFGIEEIRDNNSQQRLKNKLIEFQNVSNYVTENNKIIPKNLAHNNLETQVLSKDDMVVLDKYIKGKAGESPFDIAREVAFNKKYKEALILCDYILQKTPNHFDCRTLKARIYAWDGDFEKSEKEFLSIIERNPTYEDAYNGILDLYWWNDKHEKALLVSEKAKTNLSDDPIFQKSIKIAMGRF